MPPKVRVKRKRGKGASTAELRNAIDEALREDPTIGISRLKTKLRKEFGLSFRDSRVYDALDDRVFNTDFIPTLRHFFQ